MRQHSQISSFYSTPFSSAMAISGFSSGVKYKYGFNTKEKDDEVAGDGNSYTAVFWQYDSSLGIRFNLDSRPNPSLSNYACFNNNPIFLTDFHCDSSKTISSESSSHYVISSSIDNKNNTVISEKGNKISQNITSTTNNSGTSKTRTTTIRLLETENIIDNDGNASYNKINMYETISIKTFNDLTGRWENLTINKNNYSYNQIEQIGFSSNINAWTNIISNYNKSNDKPYTMDLG